MRHPADPFDLAGRCATEGRTRPGGAPGLCAQFRWKCSG